MAIELLLGASGGSDGAFYPLVFLHVVSALGGFGSIGFAGIYASRAAQLAAADERPRTEEADERPRTEEADERPRTEEADERPRTEAWVASREEPTRADAPVAADLAARGAELGSARPGAEAQASAEPSGLPSAGGPQHLLRYRGPAPTEEAVPGPSTPAPGTPTAPLPGPSAQDGSVDPELEEVARYFARPARFWKAVLAVPVFGALALWVEPGGGGLDQVWDIAAMLVWALAALVAAGLVVPSLRQVRSALLQPGTDWGVAGPIGDGATRAKLARYGRLASRGAAACDVLFFVALAFMIWKP